MVCILQDLEKDIYSRQWSWTKWMKKEM